jgi:hypothetical protein
MIKNSKKLINNTRAMHKIETWGEKEGMGI